jgi:hypothetical protein
MTGHEYIVEMRKQGFIPASVFIHMSDDVKDNGIYVGDKPAHRVNLNFLFNVDIVHLIPSDNLQNVVSWWCKIVDAKPKFLITVMDGEVETWKQ